MTDQPQMKSIDGKNEHTENFPVASHLVRAKHRKHIMACYVFARAADNIGDDPLMPADEKIRRLNEMEEALLAPTEPAMACALPIRASLKELGITPKHAQDLLHAFKQDAVKSRYENWADLLTYCAYSANPVGRQVLAIHGIGEEAWPSSDAVCTILQIVNHMQDCADDYRELDRVYIPLDLMEKNGCTPEDLAREASTPGLRRTLLDMCDLMEPMLKLAMTCPAYLPDWRLRMEIAVICVLAKRMIAKLRVTDPLAENAKLTKFQKISALLWGIVYSFLAKKA